MSASVMIDHTLRGLDGLNDVHQVHHVHRFGGDVPKSGCPHTLRHGFDSPEPGAASRAVNYGSGFFTFVKLRARNHSMVGRVGRAQALPALVRSVNPARPTTPFDSVAVGSDLSPGATTWLTHALPAQSLPSSLRSSTSTAHPTRRFQSASIRVSFRSRCQMRVPTAGTSRRTCRRVLPASWWPRCWLSLMLSRGSIMVEPRNTGTVADLLNAINPGLAERELHITIWHDDYAQFEGSAAQLVAEGIIPKDFKWPSAATDTRWEASGFKYWLRRTRPEGWKGSIKSWSEVDNWFIRIQVSGRDHAERNHMGLVRKAAELRAEFHHCTPAGQREHYARCRRYWTACDDKAFQAFKALIPGLIPAKRGRKAKTTTSGAAQ